MPPLAPAILDEIRRPRPSPWIPAVSLPGKNGWCHPASKAGPFRRGRVTPYARQHLYQFLLPRRGYPSVPIAGSNGLPKHATRCHQILDHPQAQRKSEIQPNGMGYHLRRKSVTTIKRITGRSGHAARSNSLIDAGLTLLCPAYRYLPTASAFTEPDPD